MEIISIIALIITIIVVGFFAIGLFSGKEARSIDAVLGIIFIGFCLYQILNLIFTGIYHLVTFTGSSVGEFFNWLFSRFSG